MDELERGWQDLAQALTVRIGKEVKYSLGSLLPSCMCNTLPGCASLLRGQWEEAQPALAPGPKRQIIFPGERLTYRIIES